MKVLVLGAGVIGTTCAWYLAKAGHEVVVVDRQPGALRVPAVDLRLDQVAPVEQLPVLRRERREDVRSARPERIGRDPRARQRALLDEIGKLARDLQPVTISETSGHALLHSA